ncbi:hypothetical protein E2C01_080589 [Portunus trituberculatus]|uniref:Uncharacterized protein n=1 Tax=Portunus trituberculatus TaxID=210409 RepID=A0A5B7J002_PORTR|nr:hypothetical protein [Portunus trituberculatus]
MYVLSCQSLQRTVLPYQGSVVWLFFFYIIFLVSCSWCVLQKSLSLQVKEEIHEVVDRQVGSLRMRERQLVRQVEVVTAHETCRLGTQQARLMHSKGALTATSDLLDHCADSESNTLAKIKVDEMFS